jgi:hypothetical protein
MSTPKRNGNESDHERNANWSSRSCNGASQTRKDRVIAFKEKKCSHGGEQEQRVAVHRAKQIKDVRIHEQGNERDSRDSIGDVIAEPLEDRQ